MDCRTDIATYKISRDHPDRRQSFQNAVFGNDRHYKKVDGQTAGLESNSRAIVGFLC